MPLPFDGDDYREYLRLLMRVRGWLQRDLASNMGLSPAWASQILNAKRSLSSELAEQICTVMGLDEHDRWLFLNLVDARRAPTPPPRMAEPPDCVESWHLGAIRELARCDGYEPDPLWVASAIRPRISVTDARAAMVRLRSLGMLDEDYRATVEMTSAGVAMCPTGEQARVRLELSLASLKRNPPNERRHLSRSVALSEEAYDAMLERVEACLESLLAEVAQEPPNRVYQVSLDLFPVSLYTDSSAHPADVED